MKIREGRIEEGKSHVAAGRLDLAEILFLDLLRENPGNDAVLFELGKICYMKNAQVSAAAYLEKALAINERNSHALLLLGKCYKSDKKFESALRLLEKSQEKGLKDEELAKELQELRQIVRKENAGRKRGEFAIETRTFRKEVLPYRACLTWTLTNKCNHRCSYCLDSHEDRKGFRLLSPGEWFSVWKRLYDLYGTMAVQITGGEPAVYPRFFEILKALSMMHNFDLQTNLSWDPEDIISTVPPEYMARIGASFHPEFADFGIFIEKLDRLKKAGYRVEINFVGYPPFLKDAEKYRGAALERGIQFSLLSFQGNYQGEKYPEEYTAGEKKTLVLLNATSGESALSMEEWDLTNKTVGEREESPQARRQCRMGQMYAWITSEGEALRCCKSKKKLGNLIAGTFELLEEAQPCSVVNCMCWRNMTVGEESRWEDRWPGTEKKPL